MKEQTKNNKKKIVIGIVVVVAAVAVILGVLWKLGKLPIGKGSAGGDDANTSVDVTDLGTVNQFMGIVEAGQTEEIKADADKEVKEVFVKEGDTVTAGTALFAYDTGDDQKEVERIQQEISGYDSQIARYQSQINELAAERDTVSEANKFEYTTEIQSIELSIEEAQNNKQSSQAELQEANEKMAESTVSCTTDGVVKKINSTSSDNYDESQAFITIVSDESYRIKGTVNEQNVADLGEGQKVIIRSRVDDTTWTGTITKVDTDNPVQNASSDYYDDESADSDTTTSSKYNFYVSLDESEGLMLGQHVYIEPDGEVPMTEDGDSQQESTQPQDTAVQEDGE